MNSSRMTTTRPNNEEETQVPLSFSTSAGIGDDIKVSPQTDIQELNSIAAVQHYSMLSTYLDLHLNNRQCIPIRRDNALDDYFIVDGNNVTWFSHRWDANGATILHQCFQNGKYELVKWIITHFPKFSLQPHLLTKRVDGKEIKLPYGGQNILHMTVLAKNHTMAKWILDFYSRLSDAMLHKLLTERVYTQSGYFDKNGKHYFGETPLQFAVCTDDVEMVNLVMSYASLLEPVNIKLGKSTRSLLFYPDCNGNNVVHLCVKHSLHKMYEHIKYFAVEMLQQELMVAVHGSMLLKDHSIGEIAVSYADYFAEDGDYRFRGYVRNVGCVRLPDIEVLRDFWLAQVFKYLEGLNKLADTEFIMEFLGSLSNHFHVTADDVLDMAAKKGYPRLISELKRRLRRWLYGIEVGVKSGEINRLFNRFFIYSLNEEGHSPVTLAAALGKSFMLRHFMKENVSQKDRSYEFDLTGIEFPLEESKTAYSPQLNVLLHSSIAWICRSEDQSIYSMVHAIPEIGSIVDYKWNRMGAVLFADTVLECKFLVLLVTLCIIVEFFATCGAGDSPPSLSLQFVLFLLCALLLATCGFVFEKLIVKHNTVWFKNFLTVMEDRAWRWDFRTSGRNTFAVFQTLANLIRLVHLVFLDPYLLRTQVLSTMHTMDKTKLVLNGAAELTNWIQQWRQNAAESRWSVSLSSKKGRAEAACGLVSFIYDSCAWLLNSAFDWANRYHCAAYPAHWDMALKFLVSILMSISFVLGVVAFALMAVVIPFKGFAALDVVATTCSTGQFYYLVTVVSLCGRLLAFISTLLFDSFRVCIKLTTLFCVLDAGLRMLLQNDNFGGFILTLLHIVTSDIKSFGYFFGLLVAMAALSMNIISPVRPFSGVKDNQILHLGQLAFRLVQAAAQDQLASGETLIRLLTTIFNVAANLLMVNLLIAVVSNAYDKYSKGEHCGARGMLEYDIHHIILI
jgi:hypothetical protein